MSGRGAGFPGCQESAPRGCAAETLSTGPKQPNPVKVLTFGVLSRLRIVTFHFPFLGDIPPKLSTPAAPSRLTGSPSLVLGRRRRSTRRTQTGSTQDAWSECTGPRVL